MSHENVFLGPERGKGEVKADRNRRTLAGAEEEGEFVGKASERVRRVFFIHIYSRFPSAVTVK